VASVACWHMPYSVAQLDDLDEQSMAAIDQFPDRYRMLTETLGLTELKANVWYFEPGEDLVFHRHEEQEELVFVLEGSFEVTIGDADAPETRELGPGGMYAASPDVARGIENVGDTTGSVLAIGAPAVDDMPQDP
jgi:quercetin dioxygenase-like cupin family protein